MISATTTHRRAHRAVGGRRRGLAAGAFARRRTRSQRAHSGIARSARTGLRQRLRRRRPRLAVAGRQAVPSVAPRKSRQNARRAYHPARAWTGRDAPAFRYRDYSNLAAIGSRGVVVHLGKLKLSARRPGGSGCSRVFFLIGCTQPPGGDAQLDLGVLDLPARGADHPRPRRSQLITRDRSGRRPATATRVVRVQERHLRIGEEPFDLLLQRDAASTTVTHRASTARHASKARTDQQPAALLFGDGDCGERGRSPAPIRAHEDRSHPRDTVSPRQVPPVQQQQGLAWRSILERDAAGITGPVRHDARCTACVPIRLPANRTMAGTAQRQTADEVIITLRRWSLGADWNTARPAISILRKRNGGSLRVVSITTRYREQGTVTPSSSSARWPRPGRCVRRAPYSS